jgi:hypothetical protein
MADWSRLRRDDDGWTLRAVLIGLIATSVVVSIAYSGTPAGSSSTSARDPRGSTSSHAAPPSATGPTTSPATFARPARGCGFVITTRTVRATGPYRMGKCTILEIGDSLGLDLGWGLNRQFERTWGLTTKLEDKSSTGLSNQWYFNWQRHLLSYLYMYKPHLVLILIGGNDARNVDVNGQFAAFGTPTWVNFYDRQIREITTEAYNAGAHVMWVGLPIMEPQPYRQKIAILNREFLKVVPTIPGGTYLPVWNLFATASGQFRSGAIVNHQYQVLRSDDGIHFSSVGENVLSTHVTLEISSVYHVTIRPAAPMAIDN